jgi:hypothetical protein
MPGPSAVPSAKNGLDVKTASSDASQIWKPSCCREEMWYNPGKGNESTIFGFPRIKPPGRTYFFL